MEVITIFIDDVLLRYVDIFQILVGVGMRAHLVGNHVVANSVFLASITRPLSFDISAVQQSSS